MAKLDVAFSPEEAKALIAAKRDKPTPYLKLFWAASEKAGPAKKLELLRAMAEIKVHSARDYKKRNPHIRKNFNETAGGLNTEDPCFVCGKPFNHRHHIIQIRNGGGNKWFNIVKLCRACHGHVHKAL